MTFSLQKAFSTHLHMCMIQHSYFHHIFKNNHYCKYAFIFSVSYTPLPYRYHNSAFSQNHQSPCAVFISQVFSRALVHKQHGGGSCNMGPGGCVRTSRMRCSLLCALKNPKTKQQKILSIWFHFGDSKKKFFKDIIRYYKQHLRASLPTGTRLLHLQLISANLCGIRVLIVIKNIICRTFIFVISNCSSHQKDAIWHIMGSHYSRF